MMLTVHRHRHAEACAHIAGIHTDVQCWELRWLSGSGRTRCQCISKISRNLLAAKHQSVVPCRVPKTGRAVWRSSKANITNPPYNCASKISTHRQWMALTEHAQTDRDASLLISQIVTPCQRLAFTLSLNPSTVRSTSSFTKSEGESLHCEVVYINNKLWRQTDCFQTSTQHMCPLLVAWPNMHNAGRPKQPPLMLPTSASELRHLSSDPLWLVKRGKEGGREKCWSNETTA